MIRKLLLVEGREIPEGKMVLFRTSLEREIFNWYQCLFVFARRMLVIIPNIRESNDDTVLLNDAQKKRSVLRFSDVFPSARATVVGRNFVLRMRMNDYRRYELWLA